MSLPNRKTVQEVIENAIHRDDGTDSGKHAGVLVLDLDNFRKVKVHYGHAIGERLIREASTKVRDCLAVSDTIGCLGPDEFVVVVKKSSHAELEHTAQRILDAFRAPFDFGLVKLYMGCSIGIALHPEHGDSLEMLIRSADTASYIAKDYGTHTYRFFLPEMDRKIAEYVWLDTNFRRALADNELILHYQPILCSKTGTVESVEALVRWISSERGLVSPMTFIPYAEASGMIEALGRWVMKTAATQALAWQAKGINLRIAINVSARQLRDTNIAKHFSEVLAEVGLTPCKLDIELTESCFIEDETAARTLIKQFRQIGAHVHLDDFGTGYSSLSQLSRIPLDAIKLDRSFIKGIDANMYSQTLARSMVAMAHALELAVVAEGVESEAEASFLKSVGVEYMQGFLCAQPMPADALETWLSERKNLGLVAVREDEIKNTI